MTEHPDRVVLHETVTEEVQASGADLYLTIKGNSFFTGQAAIKKAKEVQQLVAGLIGAGVIEEDISVQSVSLSSEKGMVTKSSSAKYKLRVRCHNLDKLPDVLGAVTASNNIIMDNIDWRYDGLEAKENEWMMEAIGKSSRRAEKIASGLALKIVGVHEFRMRKIGEASPEQFGSDADREWSPRMKMMRTVDLGTPLIQSTERGVATTIEYRVQKE